MHIHNCIIRLAAFVAILLIPFMAIGQDDVYVPDADFPFILVSADTVNAAPHLTDEQFYSLSTSVTFDVNRSNIRENDPFFELYHTVILPQINGQRLQLRKVFVRGAASPDGSYANNQRLGQRRSQALLDELLRNMPYQYVEVDKEVSSVTEDYGYLCLLLQQAHDADYQTVKDIYDRSQGDEPRCKQQLMAAQGGRLWQRLLRDYFPQLRAARLVLWFSRPDVEHAPIGNLQPGEGYYPIAQVCVPDPMTLGPVPEIIEDPQPRHHLIAIRTNLAHDFFYMPQFGWALSPNVQFEYYPLDGHYTYNIGMTWGTHRHWDTQEFFQVRDFQLELRRYFRGGGEFLGLYASAYAHGNKYGIGLSPTKGWEGEGGGAGLGIGYVWPLNKRGNFRLEVMAAFGYYMTYYDPYVYGNPVTGVVDGDYYYDYYGSATNFKERNHAFSWFGPTNLGIQLTYDILYRRNKTVKKGDAR